MKKPSRLALLTIFVAVTVVGITFAGKLAMGWACASALFLFPFLLLHLLNTRVLAQFYLIRERRLKELHGPQKDAAD
jgi:hypothetical protein